MPDTGSPSTGLISGIAAALLAAGGLTAAAVRQRRKP
ncbi:hypothetical protein [Streptomyces sp. KLOTTS4A1]